jgi:ABC-type lipoprotein release transport system permease subunit
LALDHPETILPDQVRRTLLDRLTLLDPNMLQVLTMRTMALLIVAACVLAAALPATRAARLDPTQTLRNGSRSGECRVVS